MKYWFVTARDVFAALIYWLALAPLGLAVPRDSRQVVVIGRDEGKFVDNAKYAFLSAPREHVNISFISEQETVVRQLRELGLRAFRYPGPGAIWRCLRTGTVVVDSAEWTHSGRLQILFGARRVQMWHGIPLKEIELALFRRRLACLKVWKRLVLRAYKQLMGRWCRIDMLVSTSSRVTALLGPAFNARYISNCGYPRNDVITKRLLSVEDLINADERILDTCRRFRAAGGYVCLYAPTFRQHRRSAFDDGVLDVQALEAFGQRHKILFVLKLHPLVNADIPADARNTVSYSSSADVYPLLRETDILCTDYSSIFFDFLLADRPMIFLAYDLDSYRAHDRTMNFDYEQIVPGPLCTTQGELLQQLLQELGDPERHAVSRSNLREEVFDRSGGRSSERFWRDVLTMIGSKR